MRKWRALATIVVAMLAAAPVAVARDLTVGVEAIDYLPAYGLRNGEFIGAAREILDAFAAAKGHRLSYRPLPVKRLLAELVHGGIDLKFPDSPDWQPALRQGSALAYSQPVIAYIDGTMVRAKAAGAGPAWVRSLGTVAGFTPLAWNDRVKAGAVELKENPSFEQLLRQVQTGRIDGAYVNVAVALHALEGALGMPGELVFDRSLPHVAGTYRLSSGTAPEIIAEFDDWLGHNPKLVADILVRTAAEKGVR